MTVKRPKAGASGDTSKAGGATKRPVPDIVNAKRAQNIGIVMSKVTPMPYAELAAAAESINVDSSLNWEDAAAIQQIVPTAE